MPGAQHDELLLVSEQLRVDPLSADVEDPAFRKRWEQNYMKKSAG